MFFATKVLSRAPCEFQLQIRQGLGHVDVFPEHGADRCEAITHGTPAMNLQGHLIHHISWGSCCVEQGKEGEGYAHFNYGNTAIIRAEFHCGQTRDVHESRASLGIMASHYVACQGEVASQVVEAFQNLRLSVVCKVQVVMTAVQLS